MQCNKLSENLFYFTKNTALFFDITKTYQKCVLTS